MSSTWFITGASRGLGRELTEQVLARGDRVAATLRTPSQLDDLAAAHGDRLWMRQLDVTDTVRMGRVVEEAFTGHERIDVVMSNAGFGVFGAAEDVTNDQVEQMIATNLTAAIHLARLVVPYLRRQGGGRIMQLSSMGGTWRSQPSRSTMPPSGALRAFLKPWLRRSNRSASTRRWSSQA
jgi:NAD(P)-dependent dehydrogenase (short-subunit alcohol dehydrogenase family)